MITFKEFVVEMNRLDEEREFDNTVADRAAGVSHDQWRAQFHKESPKEKNKPRIRERGGKMVDVNQPWEKLDSAAKKDNINAMHVAHKAFKKHQNDFDAGAAEVHKHWMKANASQRETHPELFKPYHQLPQNEKDKDLRHIHIVRKIDRELKQGRGALKVAKHAKKPIFEQN